MQLLLPFLWALCATGAPVNLEAASAEVAPAAQSAGRYIVVLKNDFDSGILRRDEDAVLQLLDSYSHLPTRTLSLGQFKSYAVTVESEEELEALRNLDAVESISSDEPIYEEDIPSARRQVSIEEQQDAPWGLARISNREPNSSTTYTYPSSAGEGVYVYVIDSGVDGSHPDFEGRASTIHNVHEEDDLSDVSGHGTHVAGTIGSKTYGVAKKTTLIGVRVFDENYSGVHSDFMAGLEFATSHARENGRLGKTVINMSLGGPRNDAFDRMVTEAADEGFYIVATAGNGGRNTQRTPGHSPGGARAACNIAASQRNETILSWSNWGPQVDLLAPGVDVLSTERDGAVGLRTGTSMAAPHVAGLHAILLGVGDQSAPLAMCEKLQDMALEDVLDLGTSSVGTPNLLAFLDPTTL